MDFASLMSAQISKSKAQAPPGSEAASKYKRRADIEAERQANYAAEQEEMEREKEERLSKKRKLEDEEAEKAAVREEKKRKLAEESRRRREEEAAKEERLRRKRLGLPDLPEKSDSKEGTPVPDGQQDIPDEELSTKLRDLNEPATLFGESHSARLLRYKRLRAKALAPKFSKGPIPTTLEPVEEKDMKVPSAIPTESADLPFLYRQLASYFTLLLSEWSIALARRETSVKVTPEGKRAYSIFLSCLTDLTPLFRKFEKGDLETSILTPILEIVNAAQERRYVDANDGYLRMSIGKAAWPIGVTMVGIHERSAREKLHESDTQAHIMSDEVTRKYLQSIKRCLSFAQTRWPPEDLGQLMG
jgi:pre-mRNA-splicing factor 18